MLNKHKVSVIIPCYNYGKYLMEAINSVLFQTYTNFEIIVVDDGSTDPYTQKVISSIKLPKTIVISIPNQGVSNARNYGLSISKGEFILFLDADDYISHDFLKKTVSAFENNKDISFVSTWIKVFGTEDYIWKTRLANKTNILGENTLSITSLFRKSMIFKLKGYDTNLKHGFEDWELWIRILSNDHSGIIIKEPLFNYRKKTTSLLTDAIDHKDEIIKYILNKHKDLLNNYYYGLVISKEHQLTYYQRQVQSLKNCINELNKALEIQSAEYNSLYKRYTQLENNFIELQNIFLTIGKNLQEIRNSGTFRFRETFKYMPLSFKKLIKLIYLLGVILIPINIRIIIKNLISKFKGLIRK